MAQVVERQGVAGLPGQGALVGRLGLLGPLQILEQVAQVHPVEGLSGLALHRRAQVRQGGHRVAPLVLQQPQVVMGRRVARITRQDRPIALVRLVQLTLLMQGNRCGQRAVWHGSHRRFPISFELMSADFLGSSGAGSLGRWPPGPPGSQGPESSP